MRTDIHRPSAINPADYQYVGVEHMKIESIGDCYEAQAAREVVRAHMARTGGTWSNHEHGGNCHICGASAIYTILFYHAATNSYIRTGNDCADKLEMSYDGVAFRSLQSGVKKAREAKAGKIKAQAVLAEVNLTPAWDIFVSEVPTKLASNDPLEQNFRINVEKYEEATIRNIVEKLVKYGNISEKQVTFVKNLLAKIGNRAAVEAQREAERANAADCPSGRVVITGTVLARKEQERAAYYRRDNGIDTKILVQADSGFKVWGNIFSNVQKGDKVIFTATVTVSKDDPKFGFYKRASKQVVNGVKYGPFGPIEEIAQQGGVQ
jgi:hypothetical protein